MSMVLLIINSGVKLSSCNSLYSAHVLTHQCFSIIILRLIGNWQTYIDIGPKYPDRYWLITAVIGT